MLMPYKDKEQRNINQGIYRQAHPEKQKAGNLKYDQAHREKRKANAKADYQAHREERKAKNRLYHQANLEQQRANSRANHQAHREERITYSRTYQQDMKIEALRMLGSKCSCPGCEVSEPAFLTIDHIHGRPKGARKHALSEAKASGWDKTKFQVLCANCNFAKRDRGFCPVHQKTPGQTNGHSPDLANPQLLLWS